MDMDAHAATRARALEMEMVMLDEGIAWADVCARYDPQGDAARRAQQVMPRLLARYERAMRARRELSDGA